MITHKPVWILWSATFFLVLAVFMPKLPFPSKKYDYFFMIDITRSMNVQDYRDHHGDPISRLDFVKASMTEAIQRLPCGSRVSLGVFTERMPTMLFSPLEVCQHYHELRSSIEQVDWRMAWVADSNIHQALANTLQLMHQIEQQNQLLVFFTDGHEAPPINPRYMPDLTYLQTGIEGQSAIKGLIVGTGDHALSRIPKHDDEGQHIGFYEAEDVPHRSTFGLPADPSQVEGYHPRNGPWGNLQMQGTEHLSSVREEYLKSLAEQGGLRYHHLSNSSGLLSSMTAEDFSTTQVRPTDLSMLPAFLAFLALLIAFLPAGWLRWHAGH